MRASHRRSVAAFAAAVAAAFAAAACTQLDETTADSVDTVPPAITVLVPLVPPTTTPSATAPIVISGPAYSYPVDLFAVSSYQPDHLDYPAADIFAACGTKVVAPSTGTVIEVNRTNSYQRSVDDPATRGGLFVSIAGDDNVRYYLAHLQEVLVGVEPGVVVTAGTAIGTVGDTGRTSGCHLHFGLSPVCPGLEWWVRRGVIWPAAYLDAWRVGDLISPQAEISQWDVSHPGVCTDPALMPWPST
jgi:peptidoglycan LD-endopeptidase LytH